jgi:hypothetical protein
MYEKANQEKLDFIQKGLKDYSRREIMISGQDLGKIFQIYRSIFRIELLMNTI